MPFHKLITIIREPPEQAAADCHILHPDLPTPPRCHPEPATMCRYIQAIIQMAVTQAATRHWITADP